MRNIIMWDGKSQKEIESRIAHDKMSFIKQKLL